MDADGCWWSLECVEVTFRHRSQSCRADGEVAESVGWCDIKRPVRVSDIWVCCGLLVNIRNKWVTLKSSMSQSLMRI